MAAMLSPRVAWILARDAGLSAKSIAAVGRSYESAAPCP